MLKAAIRYLLLVLIFLLKNIQPAGAYALSVDPNLHAESGSTSLFCQEKNLIIIPGDDTHNLKERFIIEESELKEDDPEPSKRHNFKINLPCFFSGETKINKTPQNLPRRFYPIISYDGNVLLNGRSIYLFTKVLRL